MASPGGGRPGCASAPTQAQGPSTVSGPAASVVVVSTCPDCRYCAPPGSRSATTPWPNPARWFDQPCVHCSHRLKAHDPGVPGSLTYSDLVETVVVASARTAPDGSRRA